MAEQDQNSSTGVLDEEEDQDARNSGGGVRLIRVGPNSKIRNIISGGKSADNRGAITVKTGSKVTLLGKGLLEFEEITLKAAGAPKSPEHWTKKEGHIVFRVPDFSTVYDKRGRVDLELRSKDGNIYKIDEFFDYQPGKKEGDEGEQGGEGKKGDGGIGPRGSSAAQGKGAGPAGMAVDAMGEIMTRVLGGPAAVKKASQKKKLQQALKNKDTNSLKQAIKEAKAAGNTSLLKEALKGAEGEHKRLLEESLVEKELDTDLEPEVEDEKSAKKAKDNRDQGDQSGDGGDQNVQIDAEVERLGQEYYNSRLEWLANKATLERLQARRVEITAGLAQNGADQNLLTAQAEIQQQLGLAQAGVVDSEQQLFGITEQISEIAAEGGATEYITQLENEIAVNYSQYGSILSSAEYQAQVSEQLSLAQDIQAEFVTRIEARSSAGSSQAPISATVRQQVNATVSQQLPSFSPQQQQSAQQMAGNISEKVSAEVSGSLTPAALGNANYQSARGSALQKITAEKGEEHAKNLSPQQIHKAASAEFKQQFPQEAAKYKPVAGDLYDQPEKDPAVGNMQAEVEAQVNLALENSSLSPEKQKELRQYLLNEVGQQAWLKFAQAYPEKADDYKNKIPLLRAILQKNDQPTSSQPKPQEEEASAKLELKPKEEEKPQVPAEVAAELERLKQHDRALGKGLPILEPIKRETPLEQSKGLPGKDDEKPSASPKKSPDGRGGEGEPSVDGIAPGPTTGKPLIPETQKPEDKNNEEKPGEGVKSEDQGQEKSEEDKEKSEDEDDESETPEEEDQDQATEDENLRSPAAKAQQRQQALTEMVKVANKYYNQVLTKLAAMVWEFAFPSFGGTILLGAAVGDFLPLIKSYFFKQALALIPGGLVDKKTKIKFTEEEVSKQLEVNMEVKLQILVWNLIVLATIATVLMLFVVFFWGFCNLWSTALVRYTSGIQPYCDAFNSSSLVSGVNNFVGVNSTSNQGGPLSLGADLNAKIGALSGTIDSCVLKVVVQKESGGQPSVIGCDCAKNGTPEACLEKDRSQYYPGYRFNWDQCSYGIGITQWTIFQRRYATTPSTDTRNYYKRWLDANTPSRTPDGKSFYTVNDFLNPDTSLQLTANTLAGAYNRSTAIDSRGRAQDAFRAYVGASNIQDQLVAQRMVLYDICNTTR